MHSDSPTPRPHLRVCFSYPSLHTLLPLLPSLWPPCPLAPGTPHQNAPVCSALGSPLLPAFVSDPLSFMALSIPPWREGQGGAQADQGGGPTAQGFPGGQGHEEVHGALGAVVWGGSCYPFEVPMSGNSPALHHFSDQGPLLFSQKAYCPRSDSLSFLLLQGHLPRESSVVLPVWSELCHAVIC